MSYILLLTGRRRGLDALISHFPNVPLLYRKVMVFEYIIRYSPCRRASPCIAAGLSLTARAVERNKFSISISPTTRGAYRIYSSSHIRLNLMDKVERSWEWRAPHDDRNIAVPIEVEPIGRG